MVVQITPTCTLFRSFCAVCNVVTMTPVRDHHCRLASFPERFSERQTIYESTNEGCRFACLPGRSSLYTRLAIWSLVFMIRQLSQRRGLTAESGPRAAEKMFKLGQCQKDQPDAAQARIQPTLLMLAHVQQLLDTDSGPGFIYVRWDLRVTSTNESMNTRDYVHRAYRQDHAGSYEHQRSPYSGVPTRAVRNVTTPVRNHPLCRLP